MTRKENIVALKKWMEKNKDKKPKEKKK